MQYITLLITLASAAPGIGQVAPVITAALVAPIKPAYAAPVITAAPVAPTKPAPVTTAAPVAPTKPAYDAPVITAVTERAYNGPVTDSRPRIFVCMGRFGCRWVLKPIYSQPAPVTT